MAAVLGAATTGAGALAAATAGLRAAGRRRAILLAVAAGLADSCSAVVTMEFSHVASHGLAALFTSWTVYALIVCGTSNVLLTQTAYQTGRPMVTLPVIAAITPVASAAVGVGMLGEAPGTGVAGAVGAGFAVLVTSLALACLARSVPHPSPEATGRRTRQRRTRDMPARRARVAPPAGGHGDSCALGACKVHVSAGR